MKRMRIAIARNLKTAQNTQAQLTTLNEIDMTALMAIRKKHQEAFTDKHGKSARKDRFSCPKTVPFCSKTLPFLAVCRLQARHHGRVRQGAYAFTAPSGPRAAT